MRLSRCQLLLARLLFLAYVLFTATYCLLAYIPFTYQQVHVGELLAWLTRLVHLHSVLFWPALAAALLTILPDLKSGSARHLSRGFAVAGVLGGVVLLIHPLLPNLTNDASSLRWCLVALVPLLWLAAIDWWQGHAELTWPGTADDDSSKTFLAAFATAFYLATLYFLVAIFRVWSSRSLQLNLSQWTWVLFWSQLSHLLVFFLVFVLLDLVAVIAALLPQERWKSKAACFGSIFVVGALIALALRYIVLPPLSLDGVPATVVAAGLAISLVIFATGTSIRLWNRQRSSNDHGLDLLLLPFRLLEDAGWATQLLSLIALAGLAWVLSARISRLDWEFLLQKISAILVWTIAFAIFYTISPRVLRFSRASVYAAGILVLAGYLGLAATQPRRAAETGSATVIGNVLDEFEGYDISFRLVDEMLRPQISPHGGNTGAFYAFLAENTNIPRSIHISPVDIHLVSQLSPASGRKPHIFFFVIDSLRRDYLSPYNPDVKFTPAIDAVAHDSVVFQNAFTRYGGTGLSEPSIWVGGLMVHQQYISPFTPMNSLQKLVDINHYREWISKDNVLQQVVPASPNIAELDEHIGAMHYDLCRTLQEVTQRLPSVPESPDPIFVYTQAQNIHVSVIDREGRAVPDGVSFPPPFNAAYAWRVQKMDGCLGTFLDALKKNGMYDNSVIVITSDHGDSLGEHGRWGHAYTLFPEIVRIPLIVHLPAWWRDNVKDDPQAIAFLTDLTPSLYYLLGQRLVVNNPLLGRPLFTATLEEQKPYLRNSYLLVSSYGPVYGLLSHGGRLLYIADGVNYQDYAYELDPDGSSREAPLTESQRADAQSQIREQVNAITRFYGLR